MNIGASLVCCLLFASSVISQNSLPVQFPGDSARNTTIRLFTQDGTQYCSLNELISVFHLNHATDEQTSSLQCMKGESSLKVTADNPFVVIADVRLTQSVVQLPANVIYIMPSYLIPLESFIPLFNMLTNEGVSYDKVQQRIVVGQIELSLQFDITSASVEKKSNGVLVRIRCTKPVKDYESWLQKNGTDTWLYITVADAVADTEAILQTQTSSVLKQVLVFQSPSSVQLTLKLRGNYKNSPESYIEDGTNDIIISVYNPVNERPVNTEDVGQLLERQRNRWKLDCIVIDAGHGGDDPGTIGISRTKEKDVTLAIALKLGKLMQKNLRGVRTVFTRTNDTFVELFRRGQIANEAQGKLFISIHCNAGPRKPSPLHGFEIYLLRPGKTENAVHIAERENSVVKFEQGYEQRYQELTEERFILITMAQSAYVKYSEQFADVLQQEMGKHLPLENNGLKQAGFYVLVGASMPNVLVETGYLSNKHDEKLLKSDKGQQQIAEAIFRGIKRYKQEYEKTLEEGKDGGVEE